MLNETTSNKLPILDTYLETLSLIVKRRVKFIKIGSILIVYSVAVFLLTGISPFTQVNITQTTESTLLFLGFYIILIFTAVGCHKVFLLSDDEYRKTRIVRWSIVETKFVAYIIVMALIVSCLLIPFILLLIPLAKVMNENYLLTAFTILVMPPVLYTSSRLMVLLPAVSIDSNTTTFSNSWKLSKGNGWRLAALIGLIPYSYNHIMNDLPAAKSLTYFLIYGTLWLLAGLLEIGLLSRSYSYLKKINIHSDYNNTLGHE